MLIHARPRGVGGGGGLDSFGALPNPPFRNHEDGYVCCPLENHFQQVDNLGELHLKISKRTPKHRLALGMGQDDFCWGNRVHNSLPRDFHLHERIIAWKETVHTNGMIVIYQAIIVAKFTAYSLAKNIKCITHNWANVIDLIYYNYVRVRVIHRNRLAPHVF